MLAIGSDLGLAQVLDLLDRAVYDLEQGWPEAALDALGRARRVMAQEFPLAVAAENTGDRRGEPANYGTHPTPARARERP